MLQWWEKIRNKMWKRQRNLSQKLMGTVTENQCLLCIHHEEYTTSSNVILTMPPIRNLCCCLISPTMGHDVLTCRLRDSNKNESEFPCCNGSKYKCNPFQGYHCPSYLTLVWNIFEGASPSHSEDRPLCYHYKVIIFNSQQTFSVYTLMGNSNILGQ